MTAPAALSPRSVAVRQARRARLAVALASLVAAACSYSSTTTSSSMGMSVGATVQEPAPNTLTDAERRAGWRLLFDGRTTNGWRGYMKDSMPSGWQVVDGALTRVARAGDIITRDTFRDFELSLEWKVAAGSNSGIFYRAVEGPEEIYFGAPEMQVLDDNGHPDGRNPITSAGSDYGLYPAPRGVVRPVGEWNSVRIVARGNHIEQWLNGKKIVEFEQWSDDWKQRVANSKFKQWPEYGKATEGHIGLQEHGGWVAFRNIKIRALP